MRVAVLGGGIAGLSAAYFLEKRYGDFIQVHLYEKKEEVGGWVQTEQLGPHLLEHGARSLRPGPRAPLLFPLMRELELTGAIELPAPEASQRYLYREGQLQKVPNSIREYLFSPLFRKTAFSLLTEWSRRKGERDDETIAAFFRRRLGDFITDELVDSLVTGIFAGDIEELSVKSCFPMLYQMEKEKGSFTRTLLSQKRVSPPEGTPEWQKAPFFTFKGGMRRLPEAFKAALRCPIFYGESAVRLQFQENLAVVTTDKREERYHLVISALPAPLLSALLPGKHEAIKKTLAATSYNSIATAHLIYDRPVLKFPGFGHLVPKNADPRVLGIVYDSSAFGKESLGTKLSVMMGGSRYPEVVSTSEQALLQTAKEAVEKMLRISAVPAYQKLLLAEQAIPQYTLGHEKRLQFLLDTLPKEIPQLALAGSSYYGVSVPEIIASSHLLVSSLTATVTKV